MFSVSQEDLLKSVHVRNSSSYTGIPRSRYTVFTGVFNVEKLFCSVGRVGFCLFWNSTYCVWSCYIHMLYCYVCPTSFKVYLHFHTLQKKSEEKLYQNKIRFLEMFIIESHYDFFIWPKIKISWKSSFWTYSHWVTELRKLLLTIKNSEKGFEDNDY